MPQILTDQSVDVVSDATAWAGGTGTFFVRGTLDGAQVVLIVRKYNEDSDADRNLTLTSPGQVVFTLGACELKVELRGADTNTNVNAGWE